MDIGQSAREDSFSYYEKKKLEISPDIKYLCYKFYNTNLELISICLTIIITVIL